MGFSSVAIVLSVWLLVGATNGSKIIKTLSVGAPITGAHLNPLRAVVNTQVHKTVKTTTLQHGGIHGHHVAPIYGPYAGAGLGLGGLGGYGAISPYGVGYNNQALLGAYGAYGAYGGLGGYATKYGGGYNNIGVYPSKYYGGGGHYGVASKHYGFPAVGGTYGAKGLYNSGVGVLPGGGYHSSQSYGYGGGYVNPLAYQTGISQISYNQGYPGYGSINKLRGYGK